MNSSQEEDMIALVEISPWEASVARMHWGQPARVACRSAVNLAILLNVIN